MDVDTGGRIEHLKLNVRSMERLGISAIIMEDKTGLKKNSLLGNDTSQIQEDTNISNDEALHPIELIAKSYNI